MSRGLADSRTDGNRLGTCVFSVELDQDNSNYVYMAGDLATLSGQEEWVK